MRTVGIQSGEKLTHAEQLERVRKFFQGVDPSTWGTGKITNPDDFRRAERQRSKHEENLRKQQRMKLR